MRHKHRMGLELCEGSGSETREGVPCPLDSAQATCMCATCSTSTVQHQHIHQHSLECGSWHTAHRGGAALAVFPWRAGGVCPHTQWRGRSGGSAVKRSAPGGVRKATALRPNLCLLRPAEHARCELPSLVPSCDLALACALPCQGQDRAGQGKLVVWCCLFSQTTIAERSPEGSQVRRKLW